MPLVTFTSATTATTQPDGWNIAAGSNSLFDDMVGHGQVEQVVETVEQTEVPPEQPEVEVMPEESETDPVPEPEPDPEPGPEEGTEDQVKQAKGALYTAALIIKAASDDIEQAQATYETEKAANQEWARNLVRDAWQTANQKGHCSTWDSVMRAVGLPARPQPVGFTCSGYTKATVTPPQVVRAFAQLGLEVSENSLAGLVGVDAIQALSKKHRYAITVTPEPPEDPFAPAGTRCLCSEARRQFIEYVHAIEPTAKFDEVKIENQQHCPAPQHDTGIAPKAKAKKATPDNPF